MQASKKPLAGLNAVHCCMENAKASHIVKVYVVRPERVKIISAKYLVFRL